MGMIVGTLCAASFATVVWNKCKEKAESIGLSSEEDVQEYFSNIIETYSNPQVYDNECNIISFNGEIVEPASHSNKLHKDSVYNSRTAQLFPIEESNNIQQMDCTHILLATAAETSSIRGVNLQQPPENSTVSQLRDLVAVRGGSISGVDRPELIKIIAKSHLFVEGQVQMNYFDRNTDKHGSKFVSVSTSGSVLINTILEQYDNACLLQ